VTAALLAVLLAAISGAAAVRFSGRRLPHVPVDTNTTAEARYLAAYIACDDLAGNDAISVDGDVFSLPEHRNLHRVVTGGTDVPHELPAGVAEAADAETHAVDVAELRAVAASGDPRDCLALDCLLAAHDGRRLTGRIETVVANTAHDPQERFERPLVREAWNPPAGAVAAGAVVAAGLTGVIATQAGAAAAAALIPFVAGGIVLAVIDWATAWVDTGIAKIWAAVTLVAVGALVASGAAAVNPAAIGAVALIIGVHEVGGAVIRKRRGVEGHGLGDTLVMPLLAGVPLALATTGTDLLGVGLATALVMAVWGVTFIGTAWWANRATGQSLLGVAVPAVPAWTVGPVLAMPVVAQALTIANL
jgi:hypothetical protein